jgi:alkylhydroperoxidase family enzyme
MINDKRDSDAWIHMVTEDEAEGELKETYEKLKDPNTGQVDHILRIHGLNPPTLDAHFLLYKTVMFGKSRIRRPDREVIAVVVSKLNECHY